MGWRLGVFWKGDQAFYYGEVTSYEAANDRHTILYTDGEARHSALNPCRLAGCTHLTTGSWPLRPVPHRFRACHGTHTVSPARKGHSLEAEAQRF